MEISPLGVRRDEVLFKLEVMVEDETRHSLLLLDQLVERFQILNPHEGLNPSKHSYRKILQIAQQRIVKLLQTHEPVWKSLRDYFPGFLRPFRCHQIHFFTAQIKISRFFSLLDFQNWFRDSIN